MTFKVEWADEDGDAVTMTVKQIAGSDAVITVAGNLVMLEVPDREGPIHFRVTLDDGLATTSHDCRFDVLPKPVTYTLQQVPSEFSDGVSGQFVGLAINNHGHVAGSVWYDDGESPYVGRGAIWFGGQYLVNAADLVHEDDPLYGQRITEVRVLNDNLEFAGYIEHPTELGFDGRPYPYDFVWSNDHITMLQPSTYVEGMSADGEVFGVDFQGAVYHFWLWNGDSIHRWDGSGYEPYSFYTEPEKCQKYIVDDRGIVHWLGKGVCRAFYEKTVLAPWEEWMEGPGVPFLPETHTPTGDPVAQLLIQQIWAANDVGQLLIEGCLGDADSVDACGFYVLTPEQRD